MYLKRKMGRNTTQRMMYLQMKKKRKSLKLTERHFCQRTAKLHGPLQIQTATREEQQHQTSSGPTRYSAAHVQDISSTLLLFITPAIEKIILENTNLEGVRKYGEDWKNMDEIDLRGYIGLLILAGVYRSRGEATYSLWDAENGRAIFHATMPLKSFHTFSRMLRFDNRESRPARRVTDKLAAIREVWDKWIERLPYLYNPGPEVTVDEQLVPFKGDVLFSYMQCYLPEIFFISLSCNILDSCSFL